VSLELPQIHSREKRGQVRTDCVIDTFIVSPPLTNAKLLREEHKILKVCPHPADSRAQLD
jgi:hypothetical protein